MIMAQIEKKHIPKNEISRLYKPVTEALEEYFCNLEGEQPTDVYEMVIREVEIPLIKTVLKYVNGNQRKAATMLGVNRGTLRKKILEYCLDKD